MVTEGSSLVGDGGGVVVEGGGGEGVSDVTDTGASKATVDVAGTGASKEAVEVGAVVLDGVGLDSTSFFDVRLELGDIIEDAGGAVLLKLMVCDVAGTVRNGSPLRTNVFSGSNMVLSPGISGIDPTPLLVGPAVRVLELAGEPMKPVFDGRVVVGEIVVDVTRGSLLGDTETVDATGGTTVAWVWPRVSVLSSTGFAVRLDSTKGTVVVKSTVIVVALGRTKDEDRLVSMNGTVVVRVVVRVTGVVVCLS